MNKLVWSQFNSSLIHNLQQYQAKEKFCDTTVVCEKKYFQLHRVILSNCSDYFEDIFDKTPCKHPFIVLKDVTAKEFKLILDFIYRGEVEICQSELNKFLDIARGLKIRGIKTATVLISEKQCENGEANKIDNRLSCNDSDIVEVGKHSKSFTKKKRKLDVESLTRNSNEEDDIQFEFIHTKSRNKKKIKYEKSNENSKQTTFEVAVVKEKHKLNLKNEEEEDLNDVHIKEERFSHDSSFDPQVSGVSADIDNAEEYPDCFEEPFKEECESDVIEPISEEMFSETTFSESNEKSNEESESMNLSYSSESPAKCQTLFAAKRDVRKKLRDKESFVKNVCEDVKSELPLFKISSPRQIRHTRDN